MEKRNDPAGSPRGIVSLGRGPNHGTQRVQIPGKYPASTRQQATGTVETENDNARWAGGAEGENYGFMDNRWRDRLCEQGKCLKTPDTIDDVCAVERNRVD